MNLSKPTETTEELTERILGELKVKYPGKNAYDLDGRGMHFCCEIDPVTKHPDWDRCIEVLILSKPHKHLKTKQWYTVLKGNLTLHVNDETFHLKVGDKHTINPGEAHWAESEDESWAELYSEPGWTKEEHIRVGE